MAVDVHHRVNPLFELSEELRGGDDDDVPHVIIVGKDRAVIRSGTPPSMLVRARMLREEASSPSTRGNGGGGDTVANGVDECLDGDEKDPAGFRDKGVENRKRDEIRQQAHDQKQAFKDKWHHHVNGDGAGAYESGDGTARPLSPLNVPGVVVTTSSPKPSPTSPDMPSSPRLDAGPSTSPSTSTSGLPAPYKLPSLPPASPSARMRRLSSEASSSSLDAPLSPKPMAPSPRRSNTQQALPMSSLSSSQGQAKPHRMKRASTVAYPSRAAGKEREKEGGLFGFDMDSSIAAQEEIIRQERLSKRQGSEGEQQAKSKRLEEKEKEKDGPGAGVLMGQLIGQDHVNYILMYNMLTGIRIGVSRCQAKLRRELTDDDFTARHKYSFDIVGNELTPSTKYDFKFKDYAPWVFRELREYFYLDPSDYLVSLTAKYILSELGSPGKSGSFFYFSRDYRFIIKTIRHNEHKFLRKILKEYHAHIKKNPHTLLSRFYGLHRVKLPRGRKIHFVIMNNLFPPHRDVHETYDLKGSAIGRIYPEDKAAENPQAILKDINWLLRGRYLYLSPEKKALFEEQLKRDTELLQRLGIMDYSLLTGLHMIEKGNKEGVREGTLSVFDPDSTLRRRDTKRGMKPSQLRKAVQRSGPQALDELPDQDTSERRRFWFYQDDGGMKAGNEDGEDLGLIYYLGIIDILTPYTMVKRLEHFWKGLSQNRHMISAVHPQEYGDRFLSFIGSVIYGNDTAQRPDMGMSEGGVNDPKRLPGGLPVLQEGSPNILQSQTRERQASTAEKQAYAAAGGGGGEAMRKNKTE